MNIKKYISIIFVIAIFKFTMALMLFCAHSVLLGQEEPSEFKENYRSFLIFEDLYDLLETSYAFVDLGLSEEELDLFEKVYVNAKTEYDRFGNLHLLKEEIPQYLRKIGNTDEVLIESMTKTLVKIVSEITCAFGKQTAWVLIRSAVPTNEFDTPRWHMDSYYNQPYYGVQYKFAVALKGNPTLFYLLDPEQRNLFRENERRFWQSVRGVDFNDEKFDYLYEENRILLSQMYDVKDSVSPQRGFGALFLAGDARYSALHSEPKMEAPRLFLAIVPGQECEIEELSRRFQE